MCEIRSDNAPERHGCYIWLGHKLVQPLESQRAMSTSLNNSTMKEVMGEPQRECVEGCLETYELNGRPRSHRYN